MLGIDHAERTIFKKWSEDITSLPASSIR